MKMVMHYENGWRLYVITHRRRKRIHLLSVGTLKMLSLNESEEKHFKPVTDVKPKKLADTLVRQRELMKRCKLKRRYDLVARAIAELRQKEVTG